MKIELSSYREDRLLRQWTAEGEASSFQQSLEQLLRQLLREGDFPFPLWLDRNTRELARFHQTVFFAEQFLEKVHFDRLLLRLLEY